MWFKSLSKRNKTILSADDTSSPTKEVASVARASQLNSQRAVGNRPPENTTSVSLAETTGLDSPQSKEVSNAILPAAQKVDSLIRRLGGTATQHIGLIRYGDLQMFVEELQYGVSSINIRYSALRPPKEHDRSAQTTSEDIENRLIQVIANTRYIPFFWKDKHMSDKVPQEEEILEVLYRAKSIIAETKCCTESLPFSREHSKNGEGQATAGTTS